MQGDPPEQTFTELLRALDTEGEKPDQATCEALWEALRAALASELRRRSLWESSPSYLGVFGAPSWLPPDRTPGRPDPLDELAADCYTFVFIRRLRALLAQLAVKDDVDGLVFLNIRHFLHERQKEHDPLGFRVFDALRTAVRRAVEAGDLEILDGDPRVRNETVLGFRPGAAPAGPEAAGLRPLVRRWNDELLPDLVTAHGRGRQPVLGSLQRHLGDLKDHGIEAIRFKDLVDPLKEDVRCRWAELLESEAAEVDAGTPEREGPRPGLLLRPDLRLEAKDTYRALVACISDHLDAFQGGALTRDHLSTLWEFLRTWVAAGDGGDRPPSQRKLSELLGIPRERLPELFRLLQGFAAECEESIAAGRPHPGWRPEGGAAHIGRRPG